MASMRSHPAPRPSAAPLLTRAIRRKRALLLQGHVSACVAHRALPLDWHETQPLQVALRRNLQAATRASTPVG
jgi:hypothetical protein